MRRLIVTALVVLSGCQPGTPTGVSSPPARSAGAPTTTPSTNPTAPATRRPFLVVEYGDTAHYTITVLGLDGQVAATTTAAYGGMEDVPFPGTPQANCCAAKLVGFVQPAQPRAGVCCGVFLPFVSASNSRVYFPDGATGVRFLAPDGTTEIATSVPNVKGRARAVFSVSPDDRRIAVSVFDWSTRPMSLRIYLEDLAGGANHVELFSSTSQYEWPVGWHDGKLVLGVNPVPGGSAGWYHVVDPKSATRLAALGGTTCRVVGPLSPAGTACYEAPSGASEVGSLKAVDWTGLATTFYHYKGGGWAPLSPDGSSIYIDESVSAPSYLVVRRDGGKAALALQPCAVGPGSPWWLDDRHLLYHSLVQDQCGFAILDLVSGSQVKVPALTGSWADLVGRLPGGL